MNPILLRYVGFTLAAVIAGGGGGYLAVNNGKQSPPQVVQSGTIPAQPFPGQGIPAIPAIPAQPQKGKPDIGNPTISYIHGTMAGKNQVVDSALLWSEGTPSYIPHEIVGTNFSNKRNTIYWDNMVLVRDESCGDISGCSIGGVEDKIILPIPTGLQLGSFHTVSVKNSYGTSNTVQVQAVEHFETPWLLGVSPASGPVGTKAEARIWDSMQYSFNPFAIDKPLSSKIYLGFDIPANQIKSGAEGFAHVFIPSELERSSTDPSHYTFTLPNEAVYCPSWGWDPSECALAPANTMVPLVIRQQYNVYGIFFIYDYKYRGIVKGLGNAGAIDTWTSPDLITWSFSFMITP